MSELQPLYFGTRGFGLAMACVGWAYAIEFERQQWDKYARRDRYGRVARRENPGEFEQLFARWHRLFMYPCAWLVTEPSPALVK